MYENEVKTDEIFYYHHKMKKKKLNGAALKRSRKQSHEGRQEVT